MRDKEHDDALDSGDVSRRDFVRTGAKIAYVTPLVLTAVSVTERPAHAGTVIKKPSKPPIPE